jgi:histidinol dehydrogenase
MRRLISTDPDFQTTLKTLTEWESVANAAVQSRVNEIIGTVRQNGDEAVLNYTIQFDHWTPKSVESLALPSQRLQTALHQLPAPQRHALEQSAQRIRNYAEQQRLADWHFYDQEGNLLGQKVTPLDRVGLYVPGGKAAYPSSVLMNAIPAKVAGVPEIVMVVPTPKGELNELVLAAAALAGVDRVFTIGGAQAIAALAYGTAMIPAVDKIVGPGNSYVASAKRAVFGQVGIDMIAGPSEILILCDGLTNPDWIAMDLFSQAEHDEDAQSILITWQASYLDQVEASIDRLLPTLERHAIIEAALRERGALILVQNEDEAVALANMIAPEHLELSVANPDALVTRIKHAGAIFMGQYTAEAFGDYCAGPNHVLPTSRTARFSSPLGVYDFQKRSSLIKLSPTGAQQLAATTSILAHGEQLTAHARSAEYRAEPHQSLSTGSAKDY